VNTGSDCHPHDAHTSDSQKPICPSSTSTLSRSRYDSYPWALLGFAVLAAPDELGEGPDDLARCFDHDVRVVRGGVAVVLQPHSEIPRLVRESGRTDLLCCQGDRRSSQGGVGTRSGWGRVFGSLS